MVDNSLQVNFEDEVETVYSKEQLLAGDANGLLLGELIIQNANSNEDVSTYIADDTLAKRVAQFRSDNLGLIAQMFLQKAKLQRSLDSKGVDLKVSVIFFNNWSWTIIRLLFLVKPITQEDVVAVVNSCTELQIKMGAAGFRGSWSPVFPDNGGLLFNMRDLQLSNQKQITFNQAEMEITISPGTTVNELKQFFFNNNICFESDVIIETVTYGGVVSSGCHGTGKDQKSISDYLTELKVVDGHGQIVTYNCQTQSKGGVTTSDILAAAKVHLGLFGITVEYTLKVVPMKYVLVDVITSKVADVYTDPANIQAYWDQNWSLETIFYPFQGYTGDTTPPYYDAPLTIRAINDPIASLPLKGVDTLQLGENVSTAIVNHLALDDRKTKFQKLPNAIHFVWNAQLFPAYAMEFCFPYSAQTVKDATDSLLQVIKDKQSVLYKSWFPLSLFIDTRFIQHSDTLLCPAVVGQQSTHSFYIMVVLLRLFYSIEQCQEFYTAVADEWFKLGGAPHWHKEWSFLTDVETHLHQVYGGRLTKFENIRQALDVDPHNLFINSTFKKVFQPA